MKTVLVIEDDKSNRQILCLLLRMNGFRVLEASTAQEAIAFNRSNEALDLILCDLMLPDLSGVKLARELVRSHDRTAILVISGFPQATWSDQDREDFKRLSSHATDFLEKPFSASGLSAKVAALLWRPVPRGPTRVSSYEEEAMGGW